jgi:hypothetical protein
VTLNRATYFRTGDAPDEPAPLPRRAYRPPIGIPERDAHRREATILSVLLHAILIVLVVAPPLWLSQQINATQQRGPRGDGRAGGGGGGNRGTGGDWTRETLRYFSIPQFELPTVPPPEPVPVPKPEEVKPPEPPPPVPKEEAPPPPPADTMAKAGAATEVASVETGKGGGSGKDGTAGSGPGSGGGTGSGVGTGRGSGAGPGTGNGNDDSEIFPPTVIALPILPLPVPGKVRPYKLVAYFEVDTLGNSRLLSYNPSNDGGYNRRIREMLGEIRFRPAVRGNGRPVLDTAIVTAEAPRS